MNDNVIDVFLCDDSLEGIFSAIYKAWEAGTSHTDVRCKSSDMNYSLFENFINTQTDISLSDKVIYTIKNKLGNDIYEKVFIVVMSSESDKASVIYHCLQRLFKYGRTYINNINDDYINRFFVITRKVGNEVCFYREFVRFSENEQGILVSKIEPDNNIIYMIIEHFTDRLHCEDFIIYDTKRKLAYIHSKDNKVFFYQDYNDKLMKLIDSYSQDEVELRKMWVKFYDTIAIDARKNYKLQRNKLPLKYRKYLTEFENK